jgi:hypothetical protein
LVKYKKKPHRGQGWPRSSSQRPAQDSITRFLSPVNNAPHIFNLEA